MEKYGAAGSSNSRVICTSVRVVLKGSSLRREQHQKKGVVLECVNLINQHGGDSIRKMIHEE